MADHRSALAWLPQIGGRSHGGDVRGIKNIGACAGCTRTLGSNQCRNRNSRGKNAFDNTAHGLIQTAWCIHAQDNIVIHV